MDHLPISRRAGMRSFRRSHFSVVCVALLAAAAIYALSYAPYMRWRFGTDPDEATKGFMWQPDPEYVLGKAPAVYAPVEWLIDETPMKQPLLSWAQLWGVQWKVGVNSGHRQLARRFREIERRFRTGGTVLRSRG